MRFLEFLDKTDIYLVSNCNTTTGSYCNYPHTYANNVGMTKEKLAGGNQFKVLDYEVFQVTDSK